MPAAIPLIIALAPTIAAGTGAAITAYGAHKSATEAQKRQAAEEEKMLKLQQDFQRQQTQGQQQFQDPYSTQRHQLQMARDTDMAASYQGPATLSMDGGVGGRYGANVPTEHGGFSGYAPSQGFRDEVTRIRQSIQSGQAAGQPSAPTMPTTDPHAGQMQVAAPLDWARLLAGVDAHGIAQKTRPRFGASTLA